MKISCYLKYNYTKESNSKACKKYIINHPWMKLLRDSKTRCNNIIHKDYHRYGGRGIKNFLNKEQIKYLWFRDKAYKMQHPSLDRKNNDGNYELDNCQIIELNQNAKKYWLEKKK